MFVATTFCAR